MKVHKYKFCNIFEKNIPQLKKDILLVFNRYESRGGYKIVWEEFENVIDRPLKKFLKSIISNKLDIIKTKSKSTFPDWKIKWKGKLYAIDVKSGEDNKDPWYDMGRIDTFLKNHIEKYEAEFYITVKWKKILKNKIKVLDIYIEPFYKSVGYDSKSKGVKYRPYDGKLRPKSWDYFKKRKCYWKTKNAFLRGLKLAKKYRHTHYILNWANEMSSQEVKVIIKNLKKIASTKNQKALFPLS